MSPQEAQQHFSEDVGFQADPALKDVARCIYMVPESHTLYVNERMFSLSSLCHSERSEESVGTAQPSSSGCTQTLRDAQSDKVYDNKENNSVELRVLSGEKSYPSTHENIPYEQIVEVLEEQMGGKPDIGSRNNFIFSMACHLRYICNDDPAWIAEVLPTYGEEREKFVATVKSACQRIQTKVMPRIIKRTLDICRRNSELRTCSPIALNSIGRWHRRWPSARYQYQEQQSLGHLCIKALQSRYAMPSYKQYVRETIQHRAQLA